MVATIAAKDAEAAAAAAKDANAKAKALRENATPQQHPKTAKRQDLRGDMQRWKQQLIFCKGCIKETSSAGWSQHCITHHSKVNGKQRQMMVIKMIMMALGARRSRKQRLALRRQDA